MHGWLRRIPPTILLFAVACLVSLTASTALGADWIRVDSVPSIRILGSGNRLSLLVTARNARLLIASGNDGSAFGNALGHALKPTSRRLDVLILAGGDNDLPVAGRARRDLGASSVWVLAGPLARHLSELHLDPSRVIAASTRFQLGVNYWVTITPASDAAGDWSAVIQNGHSIVYAGTTSSLAAESAPRAAAVIVTSGKLPAAGTMPNASVVSLAASSGSFSDLQNLADAMQTAVYAIRVSPGQSATIDFSRNGIALARGTRRLVPRLEAS
jgi:hypothetical protein